MVLFIQAVHATGGNYAAPPWRSGAHSPSTSNIVGGILNTTVRNPNQLSYTGPYPATLLYGNASWTNSDCSGCTAFPWKYFDFNGTFVKYTLNSTNNNKNDYAVEFTFYYWFNSAQTGKECSNYPTQCNSVTSHWLDIEIKIVSDYNGANRTSTLCCYPYGYIGLGGGVLTYRQILNYHIGYFNFKNYADPLMYYCWALAIQNLTAIQGDDCAGTVPTHAKWTGVEVGGEGYGVTLTILWYYWSFGTGVCCGFAPIKRTPY